MADREAFAGGDQDYLRDEQYADGTNLDARALLHDLYSTATEHFPNFAASFVAWTDPCEVLDCGAGTGRFWTNRHTPKSARVTVTDLSPGMVERAMASALEHGFENVVGHQADAQSLPFNDDYFDVVVANHMLYHVPDPDLALAELARVVKPTGTVVTSTNGRGHMSPLLDAISEAVAPIPEQLADVFGIETGEARLREWFRDVTWHAYDNDLPATDPAVVLAYATSFPPGDAATDHQRAALLAAIERRFVAGVMKIRPRTGVFISRRPR